MAKSNFLLLDLNETRTKKLAETITSPTSRKILNYLAEKEDTEANIAKELEIPISTVHYHLQKLQEAKLVNIEEFHYSEKGRVVNHYKLANKYIIIAPRRVSGLREKLKGILPVAIAALGISAVIKWIQSQTFSSINGVSMKAAPLAQEAVKAPTFDRAAEAIVPIIEEESMDIASGIVTETAANVTQRAAEAVAPAAQEIATEAAGIAPSVIAQQPDIAFWFLAGSFVTLVLYLLASIIREHIKNKKE